MSDFLSFREEETSGKKNGGSAGTGSAARSEKPKKSDHWRGQQAIDGCARW